MEQAPGPCLWIMGIKKGEKFGVGEVPQPGAIVGHGVQWARDVVVLRNVAVGALVEGLVSEKVGGWPFGAGGAFALPKDGRGVVVGRMDRMFGEIGVAREQLVVDHRAGKFQVADTDSPRWVAGRYQL